MPLTGARASAIVLAVRTCSDCGVTKPLTDFSANKGTPWTHSRCKPCRALRTLAAKYPHESLEALRQRQQRFREAQVHRRSMGRTCKACGQYKPASEFTSLKNKRYLRTKCRDCRAAAAKAGYLPRPKVLRAPPAERTCTQCGLTKPIVEFVHICRTRTGYYGKCRTCRNAAARARYRSSPEIRAADIARSRRNKLARRSRKLS